MPAVVSLFVHRLSFLWCLRRAMLRDCGISWISSLIVFLLYFQKSLKGSMITKGQKINKNTKSQHETCYES